MFCVMVKRVFGFIVLITVILTTILLWYGSSVQRSSKQWPLVNDLLHNRNNVSAKLNVSTINCKKHSSDGSIKNDITTPTAKRIFGKYGHSVLNDSVMVNLQNRKISCLTGKLGKSSILKSKSFKEDINSLPEDNISDRCIKKNICKNRKSKKKRRISKIYYYERTNFSELLSTPVDYDVSIKHEDPIVPRIVHFILFSKKNKRFKFYYMVAILAASRYVKPDKIYFWHDNPPVGKYWRETKRRVKNLYLVHRERPVQIFGNPVTVVEHASDIARLEILLEYGGIYLDTDSVVVNPIDELLYYDITMGNAVDYALANGIIFAKPWSDFMKIWYRKYETFNDKRWAEHSVIMAFKLSQLYPDLIRVEPTSLCRPNFGERHLLFGPSIYPWKKNNYVVHLYMRYSDGKGKSPYDIKNWKTTVGQIMRHIYFNEQYS